MTEPDALGPAPKLTPLQWLICAMAAIGFAFDIYQLLIMPLILKDTVETLIPGATDGNALYLQWQSILLFAPLVMGGVFGLIGGYLTDLWGRRAVLVWSILLYCVSAVAAGFSRNVYELLIFRCLTLIGVCVEFIAAVAWLAEIFPHPKQRAKVLGFTQAFSSIGGLLAAMSLGLLNGLAPNLPAIFGQHEVWRYVLISGVIPAIPLLIIRPFMPESPVWKQRKQEGSLRRPSFGELFQPKLFRTTVVTTILFGCAYGSAFGAIQYLPQIVPGIKEASAGTIPRPEIEKLKGEEKDKAVASNRAKVRPFIASVQTWQELGGLLGRFALAILVVQIASWQTLLRIFQLPGLIIVPLVFWYPATSDLTLLKWGAALAGFFTVAQFSYWGNYLPLAYPVHLRGTGGIFAANVGGRILGTAMFPLTAYISQFMAGAPPAKLAHAAAIVGGGVFFVGLIASFFLPEPTQSETGEG